MASFSNNTLTGAWGLFSLIHSQLLANGWTDYDPINTSSGTWDYVMRGQPLDGGVDNAPLIRIWETNGGGYFNYATLIDWDPVTHTGVGQSTSASIDFQDTRMYWTRTDGKAFTVVIRSGTTYTLMTAGFLRRALPSFRAGMTKTTAVVPVGSTSIPVSADMTNKLFLGQKVMLVNYSHDSTSPNFGNAEMITISSITTDSITISSPTVGAYDVGSLIGENVLPAYAMLPSNGSTPGIIHMSLTPATNKSASSFTVYPVVPNNLTNNLNPDSNGDTATGLFEVIDKSDGVSCGFLRSIYSVMFVSSQSAEDTLDDHTGNTFISMGNASGGNWGYMIGPRES